MAKALHLVYITQYFHCLYCPLVRFLGAIVLRTASFSMFGLYKFAARPSFGRCTKYRELGGKRECFRVRNNELSDLEGFEMGPGQDIPAAIKTLAVSAPKIERGSARRIGHQDNG